VGNIGEETIHLHFHIRVSLKMGYEIPTNCHLIEKMVSICQWIWGHTSFSPPQMMYDHLFLPTQVWITYQKGWDFTGRLRPCYNPKYGNVNGNMSLLDITLNRTLLDWLDVIPCYNMVFSLLLSCYIPSEQSLRRMSPRMKTGLLLPIAHIIYCNILCIYCIHIHMGDYHKLYSQSSKNI
jgi:hypothetical protein